MMKRETEKITKKNNTYSNPPCCHQDKSTCRYHAKYQLPQPQCCTDLNSRCQDTRGKDTSQTSPKSRCALQHPVQAPGSTLTIHHSGLGAGCQRWGVLRKMREDAAQCLWLHGTRNSSTTTALLSYSFTSHNMKVLPISDSVWYLTMVSQKL